MVFSADINRAGCIRSVIGISFVLQRRAAQARQLRECPMGGMS
jgi:hypothetical protein